MVNCKECNSLRERLVSLIDQLRVAEARTAAAESRLHALEEHLNMNPLTEEELFHGYRKQDAQTVGNTERKEESCEG